MPRYSRALALALVGSLGTLAAAQLSPTSFWPRLQRDARNSGEAPVWGFAQDLRIAWSARISDPAALEQHATPVFSPDNQRLYLAGDRSTLRAVEAATGATLWQISLGDATGVILATPAVADDGAIYVGSWDAKSPYDGFAKIIDAGDHAEVAWTWPMRRMLASPLVTPDAVIVVGGQHASFGWGYFGLADFGTAAGLLWHAAALADPGDPTSTGAVGASPALSADGTFVVGGSDDNRTLWQVDCASGLELLREPLDAYVWAASPLITADGFVLAAEGLDFAAPDDTTQGKLYAFAADQAGTLEQRASLALGAGHLNGGVGTIRTRSDGRRRLFVPTNGQGKGAAQVIAVDFDPDAPSADPPGPVLSKAWSLSIGSPTWAYPTIVQTRDATLYTISQADQRLYALADADAAARVRGTIALTEFSAVPAFVPGNRRGPQGVILAPDGTILWHAVDGYLYAIRGWPLGDVNGDERVDAADLAAFTTAILDRTRFDLLNPEIELDRVADFDADGDADIADASLLSALLAGG